MIVLSVSSHMEHNRLRLIGDEKARFPKQTGRPKRGGESNIGFKG
jgi:hypothetical protein